MADRIRFIREAQTAGLTLAEVTSVLELKDTGSRSCEHTLALVDRHLAEIDVKIAALSETRATGRRPGTTGGHGLDPTDCTDRTAARSSSTPT